MSGRAETEDHEDAGGNESGFVPQGALAQAQEQEEARVTLHRALRTGARMLDVRGYSVTAVAGHAVREHDEVLRGLQEYRSTARAAAAEKEHEIVMEAKVPASPKEYSTAWARDLPPNTKLAVVVIDQGNVDTMREITEAMHSRNKQSTILLSRKDLTAYSKKFLVDSKSCIEYFQYAELQAAICDHSMVPRHVPLNSAQTHAVKSRYNGGRFPQLLSYDPMVRFLGLPLGSVVAVREIYGREQAAMTYFEVSDM
jgi:DNA-directed RNA polymerase subunit H (RpoH/RPB5)